MPIKYVPFIPEPVEGQAVLGNFNRVLKYKGADDMSMVLQRGMPLYEMEKQETVGENKDGNLVIRGECVSACAYLKEQGIQVDLVYIDPPFASGADYAKKVYLRRNPTQQEMEQKLSWLQTIARVLERLHVKKDLNLAKMTDEEYQKLRNVVIGIDQGVPVPFSFDGVLAYGKIEFGGISVLLNLKKSEDGKGVYLSNFFDMENLKMTDEAGQSPNDGFAISPYILMDATLLSELDNVDLNEIVQSVEKQSYSTPYGDRIINLTLELLKLYDQSKNLKILDVCLQLLSFVGEHRDTPKELIAINRLQIEKRRRVLSTEEKEYLLTLKRPEVILPYQFAASILLESFQEADLIYERMNENEKKLFDGFPIENLWRNSDYRS